jgi:hypothetical protein
MFKMQSSFTQGELHPLMLARADFDGYFKGAQYLRNLLVIPQGGATRRFGTRYVASIAAPASDEQLKTYIFDHSDGNRYRMVFRALQILIYHNEALVQTLISPYAAAQIQELQYTQSTDALLIAQKAHTPRSLTRVTALHDSWAINGAAFKREPTYDFNRDIGFNTGTTFAYMKANGVNVMQVGDNLSGVACQLQSNTGIFTADMVGGLCVMFGGVIAFTSLVSATAMAGYVKEVLDVTSSNTYSFWPNQFYGDDVVLTEPCFSILRGWPTRVSSFQNRIIFGNTESIHDAVFNGAFNGFYNNELDFDDGSDDATAAFTIQVGDGNASEVRAIYGGSSLFVFTRTAVYTTNVYNDNGYSFENAALVPQAKIGIMEWAEPQELDGKVIFAEAGGRVINGLTYSNDSQGFGASNLSLLASHLIRTPRRLATYKNPAVVDGKFLFCINDDDGTLATLQVIEEQKILAWTLSETNGEFLEVATSDGDGHFIVKRNIDGNDVYYLETIDFSLVTDCAVTGTNSPASATITGLSHLEGEEVKILSGYRVVDTLTVSGGEVTLDEAIEDYQVGLNFETRLDPMPMVISGGKDSEQMDIYGTKHINTVYVDFYESLGIKLNGVTVPYRQFGDAGSLSDPVPQSGVVPMTLMGGWNPRQAVSITQDEPYPMTIRAIGYSVDADLEEQ